MTILQSILVGALQGVTEFLPVSSSGHLALAKHLFQVGDVPPLFDIMLHMATLLAVVIYFRKVIGRLFMILFRAIGRKEAPMDSKPITDAKIATLTPNEQAGRSLIIMVIISTIVTGAIGIVTSKVITRIPLTHICIGFLITAALLVASSIVDKHRCFDRAAMNGVSGEQHLTGINWWQALIVGFAQGIGTLPGISRSGATISGALFSGVDRRTAGDYSFIVAIPAILGAFILELKDLEIVAGAVGLIPLVLGCVTAFVSGYLALAWLMNIIRRGHLEWFALYLVPAGILGLIFF
ncbi:MAG: undecaprenyl-diphosphate phosphatase [Treponemataceae bacterium]|nr:undecaprenyl-diphosphate phosphatase [Treponemataceae bacterium]MDE7392097.1 undecaprenyl-diphosphate phosphatase [Treponemataceae bacterium]